MSDSLTLGAGSGPETVRATPSVRWWRASPYGLPLYALWLWGRRLAPLVLWFGLGGLGRFGLMQAASRLPDESQREWRLAGITLIFVAMVLLALIVTVGMLYSLRGVLSQTRAGGEGDEPLLTRAGRAVIAFVAVYLAWGGQAAGVRELAGAELERYADRYDAAGAAVQAAPPEGAVPAGIGAGFVPDLEVTLPIIAVAVVARYVLVALNERRHRTGLAFGVVFFEVAYIYCGALLLLTFVAGRRGWSMWQSGTAWWNGHWAELERTVPGWRAAMEWAAGIRPHVAGALLVPVAGLTLAALVHGSHRAGGTTVSRLGLDRWPAMFKALRFTLRGGAPLLSVAALCAVLLQVGADYAERGAYYLIGTAHPQLEWQIYQVPIRFGRDLLLSTLMICLFAAAFDVSATRQRAKRSALPGE